MGRLADLLPEVASAEPTEGGLLTDYARDVIAGVSFAVGVVSLVVSAIGLIYSILSWRAAGRAKTAAEAAKQAAEAAEKESRRRFEAFAAGKLRNHVQQVSYHLHRKKWGEAAVLLREIGEEVGHLAVYDAAWQSLAEDMCEMAESCTRWSEIGHKNAHPTKWSPRLNELLIKLSAYHRPI
jgi:hypothetical protein